MEINRKEIIYSKHKLNESTTYYQVEDDCEDFKVFINDKKEVFLLKNIKSPKCQFFPNQ